MLGTRHGSGRRRGLAHRRGLLAVVVGSVVLGCAFGAVALANSHSAGVQSAQSTVPNLTGSWSNKAAPNSAPPWQLTASNGLQNLDATWRGGSNHPDLRGDFETTLVQSGGFYEGPYHVSEGIVKDAGTITVVIDSANQIEFSLQSNKGGEPQKYVFIRVSAGAMPPAAVDVGPTPATFGTTVSENAPMPGDVGADPSPPLGNAKTADASVTGLSQNDLVFYAVVLQATREYCYLEAVRSLASLAKDPTVKFTAQANAESVHNELLSIGFGLGLRVTTCMSDAATIQGVIDRLAASAGVHAAAGCGVTPLITTVRSTSGTPVITKIQTGKRKGLSVRCSRSGSSVTMHIASTSGKPLSKLVGKRLIIGMVRSRHDAAGGRLSFVFKKH